MTKGQRQNYERLNLPIPPNPPKGWAWCRADGFKLELRPEKREHSGDCPRAAIMKESADE